MTQLKDDKRFANTLARGLNILRAFGPADNGLSNMELSERTGIPRSTVSRLTFTLCALGYLTHGRHHDVYRLGPASLALGNIASASFAFIDIAAPIMQRLANDSAALVGVAVHDEGEMLMVKTWRPMGSPAIWLDVGFRMPVLGSSTGASFLGALSKTELSNLVDRQPQLMTNEIGALARRSREQILTHGCAFVEGRKRFTRSINAVATPYRPSEFGEPVAFLCGANAEQLSDTEIRTKVGPALASAIRDLQEATGQSFAVRDT